jgi:hypothetical protein
MWGCTAISPSINMSSELLEFHFIKIVIDGHRMNVFSMSIMGLKNGCFGCDMKLIWVDVIIVMNG